MKDVLSSITFSPLTEKMNSHYRISEDQLVPYLIDLATFTDDQKLAIRQQALHFIEEVRRRKLKPMSIENFLQTYDLSSQEGLALMCLAEALLRIPDSYTQTILIRDKIGSISWAETLSKSDTLFGKLTSFGLATTDALLSWGLNRQGLLGTLSSVSRKLSEPMIRQSINQTMKILGRQFVMGETIEEAIKCAKEAEKSGYRHSFDMLGEAAKTHDDAEKYFQAYLKAIDSIAKSKSSGDIYSQPSISIKLSALHPRYELSKKERLFQELLPQVKNLVYSAKDHGIGLTIDAEESERLEISLELIYHLIQDPYLHDWQGFGLAVQAYQKRAPAIIDWLVEMGEKFNRRFCVRLVKGAYWDAEIKKTQELGLSDYPVFTRKVYTDLSYVVCSKKMLANPQTIYPQFATHNAYTLATILHLSQGHDFELQRLHGMGEALYEQIVSQNLPCRIYAPVGRHEDLLAYLVRRLLENGANTSFVNKIYDESIPMSSMVIDPVDQARDMKPVSHPFIPSPKTMLLPHRLNSNGYDLMDQEKIAQLSHIIQKIPEEFPYQVTPLLGQKFQDDGQVLELYDPAQRDRLISHCILASETIIINALDIAEAYLETWRQTSIDHRAQLLEALANQLETQMTRFIGLLVYEGGKTWNDAIAEVREAIDFCRYYANQARHLMANPLPLPGPTGEKNELTLHGRGIFVCISPWNFPLAIFLGQVAAALVTGNCVIAKPAQQTPLIAYEICQLAHKVGIPKAALQFLPAKGSAIGQLLLTDPRVSGVAFTGSTEVAWTINQTLSQRRAPIATLIAETGGINAMIVDSSALAEQVVSDIIISAFQSAGQRCSALRLLFLQEECADRILTMLKGAIAELSVASPTLFETDVGPVIDESAQLQLLKHIDYLNQTAQLICEASLPQGLNGHFIAPQAWEITNAEQLTEEVFGPILHVVRFKAGSLEDVMRQVNAKGYGLTLGLHTRIDEHIKLVRKLCKSGNFYVNRSMIGAIVGVQPFGGEGLSGTGPKAGGPHYLLRFCTEHTFSHDTTAAGGNASLLASLS
jgi:RHH-type proline utilization regulon transcriptional repressor/proline dehydrogenase/delta 1-pyrroline-5-carboxylate dehydrogenase